MKIAGFVLAWVVMLSASFVLAQPTVTRGGALKKRAYQTYSTMTLYVDPTGSDSNACTASGTSACLTLAGALGKLPRFIRHAVTVNVAAGAYAEPAEVKGFNIAKGVTLSIVGSTSTRTPTTGFASGSVTASTTWSATAAPTITDSSQTLTVNDLKGAFIRFTSGTLNGQVFPIAANTASTITAPFGTTAVTVGTTYNFVDIGSVFTSASTHTYGDITGGGTVAFSFIRINRASGATWGNASNAESANITCTSCDIRGTAAASSVAISVTNGSLSLTRSYVVSASTSSSSSLAASASARLSCTSCFVLATGNGGAVVTSATGPTTFTTSYIEAASGGTQPVWEMNGGNNTTNNLWVECNVSTYAIGQASTSQGSAGRLSLYKTGINGCTYGLIATRAVQVELTVNPGNYLGLNGTTTGVYVSVGGTVALNSYSPSYVSVTNELNVEGTVYTYSFLNGLSPGVIMNSSYGSSITK